MKGEFFSPRVPSNKEYIDKEALLGEGGGGVERPCAPSEFHNQLCHNFGAFLYYLVEFSQGVRGHPIRKSFKNLDYLTHMTIRAFRNETINVKPFSSGYPLIITIIKIRTIAINVFIKKA